MWQYICSHGELYFGSAWGSAQVFLMEWNALLLIFVTFMYCQVNYIVSTVMLKFSGFSFLSLTQINGQLTGFHCQSNSLIRLFLSKIHLRQFYQNHTRILLLILNFDKIMGTLLFGFIAINIPVNSYLICSIILHRYNRETLFFIFPLLTQQFIVNVGFHYLGALYTQRLHVCCKRLFRFTGQLKTSPYQDVREIFKLSHYIMRFSTEHQFGLTYRGIALIRLVTFLRVKQRMLAPNFQLN